MRPSAFAEFHGDDPEMAERPMVTPWRRRSAARSHAKPNKGRIVLAPLIRFKRFDRRGGFVHRLRRVPYVFKVRVGLGRLRQHRGSRSSRYLGRVLRLC
jgi:hypothetical protein